MDNNNENNGCANFFLNIFGALLLGIVANGLAQNAVLAAISLGLFYQPVVTIPSIIASPSFHERCAGSPA